MATVDGNTAVFGFSFLTVGFVAGDWVTGNGGVIQTPPPPIFVPDEPPAVEFVPTSLDEPTYLRDDPVTAGYAREAVGDVGYSRER